MNTNNIKLKSIIALFTSVIVLTSCERDLSGDAEFATYPNTAEIFTDNFVGMGSDFYFPYADSKLDAFSVDLEEAYDGYSSIRIDVPNANDPAGSYAGAILRTEGAGRNLTDYDALTFWAKATSNVTIAELGFGEDFGANQFVVTLPNVALTTSWQKIIIPIPDASKLSQERGMLRYAAGSSNTGGLGYSFWLDEIKFEKLGTVAQLRPAIENGADNSQDVFTGVSPKVSGLTATFNLGTGVDVTVNAAPAYFKFASTDMDIAFPNENGDITILGEGTAIITAILAGVAADGSLTINSLGDFDLAPTPTQDPANVISIFSDAYTNVPVDFYNGYYAPYQTTTSNDFSIGGDHILNYENFNFVGIEFNQNVPTIDGSNMTKMHVDIYVPESVPDGSNMTISIVDFGADGNYGGGDDSSAKAVISTTSAPALVSNRWISVDVDLSTLASKTHLGQILFDGTLPTPTTPSSFYADNIYLY